VDLFGDLQVHPGWSGVTIDHLLLCTSGAPANIDHRRFVGYLRDERAPTDQRTEVAADMFARPPEGAGQFRYSNLGYTVAGAAIERITGEPYESALHIHLLRPLGITTAGFGPPQSVWGHGGRLRFGSLILGRGGAVDPMYLAADNPVVMSPAGRLHLTIADWSKFMRLFLVDAKDPALTPASIDRLLTLGPGGRQAMGWAPAQGLGTASFGQQGSNTNWVATSLLDRDRRRAAMVVVNDGRTSLLLGTARLAADLLTSN
jgi:CubicO group peptidase (beta-lactamase class C family)